MKDLYRLADPDAGLRAVKLTLVLPCKVGDPNDSNRARQRGEREPVAEPPPTTILVAERQR